MVKKILYLGSQPVLKASAEFELTFVRYARGGRSGGLQGVSEAKRLLRDNQYSVVILETGCRRNTGNFFRRQLKGYFWMFLSLRLVSWIRQNGAPLIVHDSTDDYTVNPLQKRLLEASRLYFKRELAVERWRSLESMRNGFWWPSLENRIGRWGQSHGDKLRPISLGLGFNEEFVRGAHQQLIPWEERRWDCLIALGDTRAKPIRRSLEMFFASHNWTDDSRIKVLNSSVSREKFYELLGQSKSCLSPPGFGWDCYRHYEALYFGALPIVSRPDIERHSVMNEQQHCLYFDSSLSLADEMKRVVKQLNQLRGISSEKLREYMNTNHSAEGHFRYMLDEFDKAE